MSYLQKLVSIGIRQIPIASSEIDTLPKQLKQIYDLTDGLFAFESALHIFPLTSMYPGQTSIAAWNAQTEFSSTYNISYPAEIIFAEDAIGGQFMLSPTGIYLVDLETNEREYIAPDIETWAKMILNDYEYLTAFTLAHDWQETHGSMPVNSRLSPVVPFILGGEFKASNLKAISRSELLRFRADLFVQIRDLPAGSAVSFMVKP